MSDNENGGVLQKTAIFEDKTKQATFLEIAVVLTM